MIHVRGHVKSGMIVLSCTNDFDIVDMPFFLPVDPEERRKWEQERGENRAPVDT